MIQGKCKPGSLTPNPIIFERISIKQAPLYRDRAKANVKNFSLVFYIFVLAFGARRSLASRRSPSLFIFVVIFFPRVDNFPHAFEALVLLSRVGTEENLHLAALRLEGECAWDVPAKPRGKNYVRQLSENKVMLAFHTCNKALSED